MESVPKYCSIYIVAIFSVLSTLLSVVHAENFSFIVVGDVQSSQLFLPEIAEEVIEKSAEFVLFCGDLVDAGTDAEYQRWLGMVQPLYDAGIGVYPVRGNHDSVDSSEPDPISVWNDTFSGTYSLPNNGPAGEENLSYSFTHKTAFVIGLDQFVSLYHNNLSWLKEQLSLNTQPHVFVFGHTAAFNIYHPDTIGLFDRERDIFVNSILAADGRTYFCGHDHFYDHVLLDDGDNDPNNDLHQYILNSDYKIYGDYRYFSDTGIRTPVRLDHQPSVGYLLVQIQGFEVNLTWMYRSSVDLWQIGVYLPGDTFTYTATDIAPPLCIPDSNLMSAIASELGVSEPNMQNIMTLTHLDANSLGIMDLNGLEYAENLEYLYLNDNFISTVPSLRYLEKLKIVEINNNPLSREFYCIDKPLIIEKNPDMIMSHESSPDPNDNCVVCFGDVNLKASVEDKLGVTSPTLLDMQELFWMGSLASKGISDITGLEYASYCMEFDLSENQLADISLLSGNKKISMLTLSSNQISDITALSNIIDLQWLFLEDNQISEISPLVNLKNMEYLWLNSNPLNSSAYCKHIPLVVENNPEITVTYDSNTNPLTADCSIEITELASFALNWLETNCDTANNWCNGADINHVDGVNILDLAELTLYWSN